MSGRSHTHLELTAAPVGTKFTKYEVTVAMEIVMKTGLQERGNAGRCRC